MKPDKAQQKVICAVQTMLKAPKEFAKAEDAYWAARKKEARAVVGIKKK